MRSPQNLTCMTKICSSLETSRKKVCYSEDELRSFPLQLRTLRQSLNDWSWRFSFTTRPTRLFGQVGVCSFLELASAHFSNCVKPCVLFSDNLSFSNLSRGINTFFFSDCKKSNYVTSFQGKDLPWQPDQKHHLYAKRVKLLEKYPCQ